MHFLIEDDNLLNKFDTIWDKVTVDIRNEFGSKPIYNNFFLKTKIRSQAEEATEFDDKKVPNVSPTYNCLAVISLYSDLKEDVSYYPQVISKKWKYIEKEKKVIKYIFDDLRNSSDSGESDEEKLFFNTLSIAFLKVFFFAVWLEEGVSTLNKSVHAR